MDDLIFYEKKIIKIIIMIIFELSYLTIILVLFLVRRQRENQIKKENQQTMFSKTVNVNDVLKC